MKVRFSFIEIAVFFLYFISPVVSDCSPITECVASLVTM